MTTESIENADGIEKADGPLVPRSSAMLTSARASWEVVDEAGLAAASTLRGYRRDLAQGAITDEQLIAWFLQDRVDTPTTRLSYESQLVRLQWFCRRHLGLASIRHLQREDFDAFRAYLLNPPAEHIMRASVSRRHELWRPFRNPLKASSAALALTIVRSFYDWMASDDIGALERSPVKAKKIRRQRISASARRISRYLTPASLEYVRHAIDLLENHGASMGGVGDEPPSPRAQREQALARARARWVIDLAVHTGLRANEIAKARAGMILPGATSGRWSLHIVRKGNLESALPLLPQVMESWSRYRALCDIPLSADTPLVCSLRPGRALQPLSRKTVWELVKSIFEQAAALAQEAGDEQEQMRLAAASTHWLRHTFGTSLINSGADIRSVRDLMDHNDISTTSIYAHVDDEKRYQDLARLGEALRRG